MGKYAFSKSSLDKLEGVHPDIVFLVKAALNTGIMDFSVIYGPRTYEEQVELYKQGRSQTLKSKHLIQEDGYCHAVDLYPYPIDMEKVENGDAREISRFGVLAGIIKALAHESGISIRWGGDWDSDGQTLDHNFTDMPHVELQLDK